MDLDRKVDPPPRPHPGNRTFLPSIVDRIAREDPSAVYIDCPALPTSYGAGYRSVTYSLLANAVNGAAEWLVDSLGGRGKDFETIAYIGPNDPRYYIFVLGAVKAGYKVGWSWGRWCPLRRPTGPWGRLLPVSLRC
jgi:acyl-CoA synthetase (AMP-forming)/AMP-acid ligase II